MSWKTTKDYRIKRRGDWYWARFQKKGMLVEESLGTKSFSTAVKLVDEIEKCISLGKEWRKTTELFEDAWSRFLSDKALGIKTEEARSSTLKEYERMGKAVYLKFFGTMTLSEVNDEETWEEFLKWVKQNTKITNYLNVWKYMSGFLSWAFSKDKITKKADLRNPSKKAKDSDEDDSPGVELTEKELGLILDNSTGPFHLYNAMGILMCMRRSERTALKKDRISQGFWMISLRAADTKIGQGRKVPVHSYVRPLLIAQCELYPDSPCVFPNRVDPMRPMDAGGFKNQWNDLREKFGIEGRGHDFKHTWLTRAARDGMNPVMMAKISGTDIKTIMKVYLHLKDDDYFDAIKGVSKP